MPVTSLGDREQRIAEAVARFAESRPVLEPILRVFGNVLMEKTRVVQRLVAGDPGHVKVDLSRLEKGLSLLAGVSLEPLQEQLNLSCETMLPVLKQTFDKLEEEFGRLEVCYHERRLDLAALSRAYLETDHQTLGEVAKPLMVSTEVLLLVIGIVLAPVLEAVALPYAEPVRQAGWLKGYCPICGSMPSISFLGEGGEQASEFLTGGGGQKFLHCSVCGCEWRTRRHVCPACENEDKDHRYYFQTADDPAERVDVCTKCGTYLPCMDFREIGSKPPMDIAAVGMVHLDAWAREKGYHPMAHTPWNQLR